MVPRACPYSPQQGCYVQGIVTEIPVFLRVREKSGNFVASQGILKFAIKVPEKSGNFVCGPYRRIFFRQILKSCPHSNVIHQLIFLFKLYLMFYIMFGTRYWQFSLCWKCADLFSRPLCWSIYWWIMWYLCGFDYILQKFTTGYISWQWLEFVLAVREMSGKSPVATLHRIDLNLRVAK